MILVDENFKFDVEYEIISIFDNVINLKLGDEIYSIFNSNIKKAPYSLILPRNMFLYLKEYIENRKKVYIPFIEAKKYRSILFSSKVKKNISLLEKKIKSFKRENNIFEKEFQKKRKNLDLRNIIGLGIGLTPSGDDYIVGIMAAYYSFNEKKAKLFDVLVDIAKEKTNFISYCYIKNASNRLFKQEIIEAINNLENEKCLDNLANFGASSGQDIMYGIYDYFKCLESI